MGTKKIDHNLARKVPHKGFVYIWYSCNGIYRDSTGIPWDDRDKKGNISIIQTKLDRVNDLIRQYIKDHEEKPDVPWLKDMLKRPVTIKSTEILDMLEPHIEKKKKKLRDIRDWTNLKTAIEKYEEFLNHKISFKDLNSDWYDDFQLYLSEEREQNSNTIRKRVITLNTFLKEIEVAIPKYHLIDEADVYFEVLTREEIRLVYDKALKGMKERIRDIFIFLTLTGIRYSDYRTLNKHHFKNNTITKISEKTRNEFIVPLHPIANEILHKYDFSLPIYPVQDINREIKEVLKDLDPFKSIIHKNIISNKNMTTKPIERYKLISSHTGRRTFITLQVINKTPLPRLMEFTGHKRVDILLGYYKKFQEPNYEYINSIII